jgi:L-ascorbate metabolism protein UlaG (beta-lactamase superfamily)
MNLIPAYRKGQALIEDIHNTKHDYEELHIWWLGQSGFLIQSHGKRILVDPYLSDSLTTKYATTDKPHTRISELVVHPSLLTDIDIVTSSHNHTDHLDAETLIPIFKNNPNTIFIIPEANRDFVCQRVGCGLDFPIGLNDGGIQIFDRIKIHGIPAKHNEIDRDENGNCKYMGYVFQIGDFKIYHSGDTLWFNELVDLLSPFHVDVALLPINGNLPERRVAGNLDCREAAQLGKDIGAKCVIPCHYNLFAFNTADVNEFAQAASNIGQPHKILRLGEKHTISSQNG